MPQCCKNIDRNYAVYFFSGDAIMNTLVFGVNIKRLRNERKVTQQQLADALGISFQAVSKWENGTTLPDVGILPDIADYFSITIDELFKPDMKAYRNKAQRLTAVYESNINDSEAFEKADNEFRNLFKNIDFDISDISSYAYLNDCRAQYYIKIAERYYLDAIEQGSKIKDKEYYKNQRQYIRFLSRSGRNSEIIERHINILENEPDNPMNYSSLSAAYQCAGEYDNSLKTAEQGLQLFPDNAILLANAGDICKALKKYDKAVMYWNKAFAIDPDMIDTRYSTAFYLKEQGYIEDAERVFLQIFQWNEQHGFDIENKWIKEELYKIRK
jgi:transcriptional regulator with XRE-family HTH domain